MDPTAETITIRETLALLDGPFEAVASGVAQNHYAFWLGSGISLGRVDGLLKIIPRTLEFLRSNINPGDANCEFKKSLERALDLAAPSDEERKKIDLGQPVDTWPVAEEFARRLRNNYARLLDVKVGTEPDDFLLWNGVNVGATYANPLIPPDVEHLCMAILVLEGVASEVATANWDGLVEKAADQLSSAQPCVVCVSSDNLKEPDRQSRIYKFHGCAIRAVADEAGYRRFLIARRQQLIAWLSDQEHKAMVASLLKLALNRPTLIVGLSAQDENVQALFAEAQEKSPWKWDKAKPSLVFSGEQLGGDQATLLQNHYLETYTPDNRAAINDGSLIRAYAKQLLSALVLHVLGEKLKHLALRVIAALPPADRNEIFNGITKLRDEIASFGKTGSVEFVQQLIDYQARAISMFRDGRACDVPRPYHPLTSFPVQQIDSDLSLPSSGLCEVGVAVAILGLGIRDGHWTLELSDVADLSSGTLRLVTATATAKVLLARDSSAAVRLRQHSHLVDGDDLIVVHASEIDPAFARSPVKAPGRTGKLGTRDVSIREILKGATNIGDVLRDFRVRVAV